jgi:hypothetical protein
MFYKKFIGCRLKIDCKIPLNIESFTASEQRIYTKYKTGWIRSSHKGSYNSSWPSLSYLWRHSPDKSIKPVLCTFFGKAFFSIRFSHRTLVTEVCVCVCVCVCVTGGVGRGLPLKRKEKSKLIRATYTWGRTTGQWYQLHETAIKIQHCVPTARISRGQQPHSLYVSELMDY